MINYDAVAVMPTRSGRQETVLRQFENNDYVCITDALVNIGRGGVEVLVLLSKEHIQRKYTLRVLCDRWGDPVSDGNKIEWTINKGNRDRFGNKVNSRQIFEATRRGQGEQFIERYSAIVRDGCIRVSRKAAVQLLNLHGVSYLSDEPLSKMRRVSSAKKTRPDGKIGQIHNWRFVEVLPTEDKKEVLPTEDKKNVSKNR